MAVQPLRLEELAEVLAFDFDDAPGGVPTLKDWRREDQERDVLSMCSSLITIVHNGKSRMVQFSHFSVKEFLTSDRLAVATEDVSFHYIAPTPAHTIIAQACLGVLLRLDDSSREATVKRFPLAEYALQHWVDHALFENVSPRIKVGIENLFDAEKPHFSRWIRVRGNMDPNNYSWMDCPPGTWTRPEQLEAAPMYYAAFCGFYDVTEKLFRERPEHLNAIGGPCGTALHAVAATNDLDITQLLLRHGADVNSVDWRGRTPLLFASVKGHLDVVRCLLEHGADANAKDRVKYITSLHMAARNGKFEIVRTLLKHNADINARDKRGRTPLHFASNYGRVDVVRLLLKHGSDPKARNVDGETALHLASISGCLDTIACFLQHGAEVNARDTDGITAYDIALDKGLDKVAQFLLEHGAESSGTKDVIS